MSLNAADQDALNARRAEEWKLRVKGYTVRDIAEKFGLGVATVHADLESVRVEMTDSTREAAIKYREVELARLDSWIKIGTDKLESLDPESESMAALLNSLKGLSERRAKLLGLDSAIKTELSGPQGGPVQVEDARALLLAKLAGLTAGESPEGETQASADATKP